MIITDVRENPSKIPYKLERKGVEVRQKQLKTGDYHIIGHKNVYVKRLEDKEFEIMIDKVMSEIEGMEEDIKQDIDYENEDVVINLERKGDDLIISIIKQLLADQLYRSSAEFYRSVLLIEGPLIEKCISYGYGRRGRGFPIETAWSAIIGAFIRVSFDGYSAPVSVIQTADKTDTIRFLTILEKKIQDPENFIRYPPILTKNKVKNTDSPEEQEKVSNRRAVSILSTFYGIAKTKARKLLSHFGSLRAVFNATPKQISEVHGFSLKFGKGFVDEIDREFTGLKGD